MYVLHQYHVDKNTEIINHTQNRIHVAPNGNFAVTLWNNDKNVHIYYSCGKLMKEVDLSKHGFKLLLLTMHS